MRIGQIVLRIRSKETYFGNYIGGAAELNTAINNTLTKDMAFVIPLIDDADSNKYDTSINQRLVERFGVIVALANDSTQADKTGLVAYDKLHNIRTELFNALCGWIPMGAETQVFYRGGKLIDLNNAYLWYQYEFEYESRIVQKFEGNVSVIEIQGDNEIIFNDDELPTPFDTVYMQLIKTPDADIPYENSFGEDGDMPYPDSFPAVELPDMANWIDFTVNPNAGAFNQAFQSGFDVDKT